jgi:2-dehydropantoate 2-reductase|tara:strand:+ start:1275 stop:2252 length:978 start_codon:yes stop_codon:yes gene_type:complete
MKICIYGAGAIGGYLGAKLTEIGADVTLIARGPHYNAIKEDGLRLRKDGKELVVYPRCVDTAEKAGKQDYIFVTLKAHSVPGCLDAFKVLMKDDTSFVWGVNGIPWWYFHNHPDPEFKDKKILSVDPDNSQWNDIGPEKIIGCIVNPASEVVKPGVIQHLEGDKFQLGEINGENTDRIKNLSVILEKAGFQAPIRPNIKGDIWLKLFGNLSLNPISALTTSTLVKICSDADVRDVIKNMMNEAHSIATKLGIDKPFDVERRIDAAKAVGEHKTSMLQDLERDRPMEIDALIGSVQELGRITSISTPTIDTVLALTKLRAREAKLY